MIMCTIEASFVIQIIQYGACYLHVHLLYNMQRRTPLAWLMHGFATSTVHPVYMYIIISEIDKISTKIEQM